MTGLMIVCMVVMAFCMLGQRLSQTIITAPMLFLALGALIATSGLLSHEQAEVLLHPVTKIAVNTVWISALLHGLTAVAGTKWFSTKMASDP